jgi:hypothetical protein
LDLRKKKKLGGGMEKIHNLFSAPNTRITQKDITRDDEKEGESSKCESDKKLLKRFGRKMLKKRDNVK